MGKLMSKRKYEWARSLTGRFYVKSPIDERMRLRDPWNTVLSSIDVWISMRQICHELSRRQRCELHVLWCSLDDEERAAFLTLIASAARRAWHQVR